jgi:hypothetical protein
MRRAFGILGVALVLLGPLEEWNHHHDPFSQESDCVACQFHHAAMAPPPVGVVPIGPAIEEPASPSTPERPGVAADPLTLAPKTSPPRLP